MHPCGAAALSRGCRDHFCRVAPADLKLRAPNFSNLTFSSAVRLSRILRGSLFSTELSLAFSVNILYTILMKRARKIVHKTEAKKMGRPRTVSAADNDYAPLVTVRLPRSDLAAVKEYAD